MIILLAMCNSSYVACQEHIAADIYKDAQTLMFNMALFDTIDSLNINC